MPGVEDPDVIDLVAFDPGSPDPKSPDPGSPDAEVDAEVGADLPGGRWLVVMLETRPWGDDEQQGAQLKAKINAYATWIAGGSLVAVHPEAAGAPVVIRLDCPTPPTGPYAVITVLAGRALAELGIGFEVVARSGGDEGSDETGVGGGPLR